MKSGKLLFCFAIMGTAPLFGRGTEIELPTEKPDLKPGEHRDVVFANCLLCHSWDYVTIQPPLKRAVWKATVQKMRATYGAPIAEEQIEPIVDYLARFHGDEQPEGATPSAEATSPRTSSDVVPGKG